MSKLLDLDAIHADMTDIVVKLKGVDHRLVPLSVMAFIENQKTVKAMADAAAKAASEGVIGDLEAEIDGVIDMVARSFPTMTKDMLRTLSSIQLRKLVVYTRASNGEIAPDSDAKVDAAIASAAETAEVPSIGSENPPRA